MRALDVDSNRTIHTTHIPTDSDVVMSGGVEVKLIYSNLLILVLHRSRSVARAFAEYAWINLNRKKIYGNITPTQYSQVPLMN